MKPPRWFVAMLFAAGLGASMLPGVASAQSEPSSWLLRYISWYSNIGSNPPNIQEPTVIELHGWFPYDCGVVTGARVIDSGHIRLTLRPNPGCADTTRQWSWPFDLGLLPLGDHTLNVQRTFVSLAGDSITENASFSFPVVDTLNTPPPPPPPPPPSTYWLMPYLSGWHPIPAQPNAQQPTTVALEGNFPYDCGVITHASVLDTGSVEFTMEPGPACTDTVRRFSQAFDLGTLPVGYRVVHIKRTLIYPDSVSVREGDFGFAVWADSVTPPPPSPSGPPEYPSLFIRCLSGWSVASPPTTAAPTILYLYGWFPYLCGQVAEATVLSSSHVLVRLQPGPACSDTTTLWFQSFDLGLLPAGPHPVTVTLDVEGDPSMAVNLRETTLPLYVDEAPVTQNVPNPFVSTTRFTVINPAEGPVDVGIFDVNGRRIATLWTGTMSAGSREFNWNGRRDDGPRAAIGVYFSRVAFSNRVVTRRLVMLPRR